MERIKLNLIPSGVAPVVHASQYDDGREFAIDLFDGDSVYVLDGTETLTVNVRKPDGHLVVESVTNTSDSYVVIATTEQMVAVSGTNYAKLKIEKGSVTIATLEFLMSVSRDPLENGDPSESFVSNLETQIASAVADQYDSANVVFDANPTAGHGVGFAVTSEGVANAVQDAKDYTDTAIGGLTIPENITDLDDVTITTPSNGEILVYNNGSWENQANPASTANFAPDYDDTATYNTNDKVIYQGLLYVCLEDSVTGAWDSTKWQNISVADYTAELLPIESGSATNTKDYIDNKVSTINTALSGKMDKLPTDSYECFGIWSETYYGSCRLWVAFPNADQYTITLTGARYRSADTTMTQLSLSDCGIAATNKLGFLAYVTLLAPANHYGTVNFTAT